MRKLKMELDSGVSITVHPPTVGQYFIERNEIEQNDENLFRFIASVYSRNDEGISFTEDDILNFTTDDFFRFTSVYLAWVRQVHDTSPNS